MSLNHGKRNSYSIEFKWKVLDYYLKNGGDSVFGLKNKTAEHFGIGKKTVMRIVDNKDSLLIQKAQKRKKSVQSLMQAIASPKSASIVKRVHVNSCGKPAVKSTPLLKVKTEDSSSSKSSPSVAKSVSVPAGRSSTPKNAGGGTSSTVAPPKQVVKKVADTVSKKSALPLVEENKHEEVLELPEDPDYSLLKPSISGGASASGVAGPAFLLATATHEVRHALVYECEVLYECKVCRNIFRSVVNYLAHKRIFCTKSCNDDKSLYPEDGNSLLTPHSGTVISEATSKHVTRQKTAQQLSSSTEGASSAYYERLNLLEKSKIAGCKDSTVELRDIDDVGNAVYQTFSHPDSDTSGSTPLHQALHTVRQHERGVTAVLNADGAIAATVSVDDAAFPQNLDVPEDMEEGDEDIEDEDDECTEDQSSSDKLICQECDRQFSSMKCLLSHQRSIHGAERTVYFCPLCRKKFLSVWTVSKHLMNIHRKTKSQIESLRGSIKRSAEKQQNPTTGTPALPATSSPHNVSLNTSTSESDVVHIKTEVQETVSDEYPKKGEGKRQASLMRCTDCSMFFINHRSLESHRTFYCHSTRASATAASSRRASIESIQDRSLTLPQCSDSPTKKIGIQIRKVYKTGEDSNFSEANTSPLKLKMVTKPKHSPAGNGKNDSANVTSSKYPNSQGPMSPSVMLSKVESFCLLNKYKCNLCNKTFCNGSGIRKHAAIHLSWTRYICSDCGYRDYQECKLVKHVIENHSAKFDNAASQYEEIHYINGPFRSTLLTPSEVHQQQQTASQGEKRGQKRSLEPSADAAANATKKNCVAHPVEAKSSLKNESTTPVTQVLSLKLKRVQLKLPSDDEELSSHNIQSKSLESIIKAIKDNPKLLNASPNETSETLDNNNLSHVVPEKSSQLSKTSKSRRYPVTPVKIVQSVEAVAVKTSASSDVSLNEKLPTESTPKIKTKEIVSRRTSQRSAANSSDEIVDSTKNNSKGSETPNIKLTKKPQATSDNPETSASKSSATKSPHTSPKSSSKKDSPGSSRASPEKKAPAKVGSSKLRLNISSLTKKMSSPVRNDANSASKSDKK